MKLDVLQSYGLNPVRPDFLDSSILSDFIRCPSYFYIRHVLGLRRKRSDPADTAAMDWGSCWHATLETYYRSGGDLAEALKTLDETYPIGVEPSSDRYKRSKARMIEGFFEYIEHYTAEDNQMDFIRHEQHFSIYCEEDDLEWSGKIDSIRRRKGKIQPWDYKTTSSMGPTYFDQFELSIQFPGYVWATNRLLTEHVNEICLDVFYTISSKQDFFRRTFRYTDSDLAEWVKNVKLWRDRLFYLLDNHLYEPEEWPKAWGQCNYWYGKKCPFFDVHSVSPMGDTRLLILQHDYEEDRWNPLDTSGED